MEEKVETIDQVWQLNEPQKILKKQQVDGSWKPSSKKKDENCGVNYDLIETWKKFRFLIEQYEFTKRHPAIEKAAEYLFSCQTPEGDIRGMLANQLAPYYTGAIMYLLIKAGYAEDQRIEKGFQWLLNMRQEDGGWVIGSPGIMSLDDLSRDEINDLTYSKHRETLRDFDSSRPFSAAGTGMVLRAFSVHLEYKNSDEARVAATLLKSKIFKKDNWSSYEHPDNWLRFQFPFWWTNLVSALDTLSLLGVSRDDEIVKKGLEWLVDHQQDDGLWKVSYSSIHKNPESSKTRIMQYWISLTICRIFKRLYNT